jgi:ectoine hydroxylase-related dioxygenase (phytanoyl-CoA dioxygenase family)
MAIDRFELAEQMQQLRDLARQKWQQDPLPVGAAATARLQADIDKYDLHRHIVQLETDGYTILPPGKAAPVGLIEKIKEAMKELQTRAPDSRLSTMESGLGATMFHMLPEHAAFEEALMAGPSLTLVTYLLGFRAKLSQCTGLIKDSGAPALALHADHSGKFPAPWSKLSNYSVVTWVLTDYTRENGAVCVWPGSHRWGKPVPADMVMAHDHAEIRVLEAPAGSVIIWHGSLWHGAVPRTASGQRMTLVLPHVRDSIQPQELFWASVTPEMIERNAPRFCTLMGLTSAGPWIQDGPDPDRLGMGPVSGSQFE